MKKVLLCKLQFQPSEAMIVFYTYNALLGYAIGAVLTTFHYLYYLQMDPISQSVCPWQAFPAHYNVTL
jgi:hypothetical protein